MENQKSNFADEYLYSNYEIVHKLEQENNDKYEQFMDSIKDFENINTIEEAKELAQRIIPVSGEVNSFVIGSAKCTIISNENVFRLSIDSKDSFVSYDFV